MTIAFIAALIVAAPQIPQPMDSAHAEDDIRWLVDAYYALPQSWSPAARKYDDLVRRYPWLTPRPIHNTWNCQGVTLDDCFGNDWSCAHGAVADCKHPSMPSRRALLIDAMERLSEYTGGSAFVLTQRVAFAIKNREPERADHIAAGCFGQDWWCMALRGLTAHHLTPGSGLAAFDSALARAPGDVGCAWRDISALAPFRQPASRCVAEDSSLALFWWLADPLWSRPGNERYAEHLSRHVIAEIERYWLLRRFRYCDYDIHVAQGIPNSIEPRSKPLLTYAIQKLAFLENCYPPRIPVAIRHVDTVQWGSRAAFNLPFYLRYVYGGYSFVPDSSRVYDPIRSIAHDWAVHWDKGSERLHPRERYYNLDHQTAVFRRGDQLLLVAAAPIPPPLDTAQSLQPFLVLGRVRDLRTFATQGHIDDQRVFRAAARADSGAYMASIEIVNAQVVGRARYGAPAPPLEEGFGLSDIALVQPTFETNPRSLEDALLPTKDVSAGRSVGIYFEVYGVAPNETLNIEVTGQPLSRGFFSRVLGSIGLKSAAPALRVSWQEEIMPTTTASLQRFLLLDIATLPAGESRLTLTVRRASGQTARGVQHIQVR